LIQKSEIYESLARSLCAASGVDGDLVCAIIAVESDWNPWVVRYESAYRYLENPPEWAMRTGVTSDTETMLQKSSFGLMQVMGGVARQYGYDKILTELLTPEDGLKIGIRHLKSKIDAYPGIEKNIIAAYNAGVPVVAGGVLKNQKYVDVVLTRLKQIRLTKKGE
jgi:soluble lytic murein transglycosylase-like protein